MEYLFEHQRRLLQRVTLNFVRMMIDQIDWSLRLISLKGPRGVGKTTIILQHIKSVFGVNTTEALYMDLDDTYFLDHNLMDTVKTFYQQGGKYLFLDEVHKYPNWSRYVKNIYDSYPNLHTVITGSSLLQILNADADLSRRCVTYDMQGLSFREYLEFIHDIKLDKHDLQDLLTHANEIALTVNEKIRPLKYFKTYMNQGYYPFVKESVTSYGQKVQNIANLILNIELPQLRGVEVGSIRKLRTLLNILACEVPMTVDINKLATLTGMTRGTVLTYLQHLCSAKLIRLLYSDEESVKKMQKPDKILLDNTNVIYALTSHEPNIGTQREIFFCNQVGYQHQVEYHHKADFKIDGQYVVEVGGADKEGKQIAGIGNSFIAADDIEYAVGNKIPLYLFGLLY